jgi:hypothetical protein
MPVADGGEEDFDLPLLPVSGGLVQPCAAASSSGVSPKVLAPRSPGPPSEAFAAELRLVEELEELAAEALFPEAHEGLWALDLG